MTPGGFREGFTTAAGAAAFGALVLLALSWFRSRGTNVTGGPAALFQNLAGGDSFSFMVSQTEAAEGIDGSGVTIGGGSCSAVY